MSQPPSLQPTSSASSSSPAPSKKQNHNSIASVPIPQSFTQRKHRILAALAVPDDEYTDLSPKGTVDAGIRDLIGELNGVEGFVTTSSCAGRVSVFLEGRREPQVAALALPGKDGPGGELPGHYVADLEEDDADEEDEGVAQGQGEADGAGVGNERNTVAGFGGKGGGGRWLFVSHEPLETHGKLDSEPNIVAALLGMEEPIFNGMDGPGSVAGGDKTNGPASRLIHFKFEPMILHVLTASPHHAQLILRSGLQAGFRESGAINLLPAGPGGAAAATTPIVAIRSMGLGLESLIGTETNGIKHCTVSGEYLKALIAIANERFVENARRIARFQSLLRTAVEKEMMGGSGRKGDGGVAWEDAEVRRERKRAEGLKRAEEVRKLKEQLDGEQPWGEEEVVAL